MMYQVKFSEHAVKELKKLDKSTARVIKNWVLKNLVDTTDPRMHGKALTGNLKGIWRYRVGDYRLFAEIHDDKLIIFILKSLIGEKFICESKQQTESIVCCFLLFFYLIPHKGVQHLPFAVSQFHDR